MVIKTYINFASLVSGEVYDDLFKIQYNLNFDDYENQIQLLWDAFKHKDLVDNNKLIFDMWFDMMSDYWFEFFTTAIIDEEIIDDLIVHEEAYINVMEAYDRVEDKTDMQKITAEYYKILEEQEINKMKTALNSNKDNKEHLTDQDQKIYDETKDRYKNIERIGKDKFIIHIIGAAPSFIDVIADINFVTKTKIANGILLYKNICVLASQNKTKLSELMGFMIGTGYIIKEKLTYKTIDDLTIYVYICYPTHKIQEINPN